MKRILLVDDNEQNLYLMTYILERSGYEVIAAKDGINGVEMVERERPDAVLMDIRLPDISGTEATRRIRASGVNRDIPIIAVTSYAMVGDREKALAAGCTGYIEQPINPETFIAEIQNQL